MVNSLKKKIYWQNKSEKKKKIKLYYSSFSFYFLVSFFFFSALNGNTLDFPLKSSGSLLFYADVFQYQGGDGRTGLDISYSMPLSQYAYPDSIQQSNVYIKIKLQLTNTTGEALTTVQETRKFTPAELSSESKLSFVNKKSFEVKAGQIGLKIQMEDSLSGKQGNIDAMLLIDKMNKDFSVSDLFFINSLHKAQQPSTFEKHGLVMIPNPSRIFEQDSINENLYVYYEINNMSFEVNEPSYYKTEYVIKDVAGNEILSVDDDPKLKKSNNSSKIEVISLKDLKPGVYKFSVIVTDLEKEDSIRKSRYFWISGKQKEQNLILPMTKEDVQNYFDQIKYIATEEEKNLFKSLDPQGKQEFLLQFWKKRDPTPATPKNEFMETHFKRLAYIENNFTNGINSDRGRIYIQYGPPLDIKRSPNLEGIAKPVEVWTYGLDGRTEFIFVDRTRDGVYVLVHSSHPDEYSNPDWGEAYK